MFQRILVPTDGSDITVRPSMPPSPWRGPLDARIYTLCVKEPFPYGAISEIQPMAPQEFFNAQERIAERRLTAVREACQAAGMPCDAQIGRSATPVGGDHRARQTQRVRPDRDGLARPPRRDRALLGSETQKVLTHTEIPVLVVR